MGYAKISGYGYADRGDGYTLLSGVDPTGRFLHQVIEDAEVPRTTPLQEAIENENAGTVAYAEDAGVELSYGEPVEIMLDANKHLLMYQEMSFDDGRKALQENAYFFDDDGVFRIVQFGTLPMSGEEWDENGERYRKYASGVLRKLLLASVDERFALKVKPFD